MAQPLADIINCSFTSGVFPKLKKLQKFYQYLSREKGRILQIVGPLLFSHIFYFKKTSCMTAFIASFQNRILSLLPNTFSSWTFSFYGAINPFTANVQCIVWKLWKIQDNKIKNKFISALLTGCLLSPLVANTMLFAYVC